MARSVLIHDSGLYPSCATTLAAQGFDTVYYFSPYNADSMPLSSKSQWGVGLPGVTRVNDFFDFVDEVDLIVFPDIGSGDLQAWLRKIGYRVWGSAEAEILEQDRVFLKQYMKAKKMNLPAVWFIEGVDTLRTHLESTKHREQWVKFSEFRGDFETHHHENFDKSEQWLDRIKYKLGKLGESLTFVVEAGIEGVEIGFDGICIDGQFASPTMYGYEHKDIAYLGRVCDYADLPSVLMEVNDALAPILKELGCRSLFSTEVRVTEDGVGYLIDPTLRFPSPPSEALMEVYTNWGDIMFAGAGGTIIPPTPRAKFVAEVILKSHYAESEYVHISFPEDYRHLIRLHGHAILDSKDYVVNIGMDIIGAAVGIGDTVEDATKQALEVAHSITAEDIAFEDNGFDDIYESIERGQQCGVDWP